MFLLNTQIDEKVKEYAKYIFEPVDSSTGAWVLVHEDGDMKVCIYLYTKYIYITCTYSHFHNPPH